MIKLKKLNNKTRLYYYWVLYAMLSRTNYVKGFLIVFIAFTCLNCFWCHPIIGGLWFVFFWSLITVKLFSSAWKVVLWYPNPIYLECEKFGLIILRIRFWLLTARSPPLTFYFLGDVINCIIIKFISRYPVWLTQTHPTIM